MTIGLHQFRDERQVERLHRMLLLPLTGPTGESYGAVVVSQDITEKRELETGEPTQVVP